MGDETKQFVCNHITSFPKQSSHYSRSKSETEYLSPDLTLQKMYNLYKKQNPETVVSKRLYVDIFRLILILVLVCYILTHINITMNYTFNSQQQILKKTAKRFSYSHLCHAKVMLLRRH
jgi:hypothetical protein